MHVISEIEFSDLCGAPVHAVAIDASGYDSEGNETEELTWSNQAG